MMGLSRTEAYDILELPIGADPDTVRTSYKRLAMKWHPDKHANSLESKMKFQQISTAYKRLLTDNETSLVTLTEMFELYQQVFFPKQSYRNGYGSSDDSDSNDSSSDDFMCFIPSHRQTNNTNLHPRLLLSAEEIERNAAELITEEEKEKKKAEKRRAKKKRQREKKRKEKQNDTTNGRPACEKTSMPPHQENLNMAPAVLVDKHSSGSEAEGFDPSAAFFKEVKSKKKKQLSAEVLSKVPNGKNVTACEESLDDLDATVLRSRQLAIRGNEMANSGHYQAAIDLFTEAIKLDTKDFRFFGNRSYCFDRMQQYERALKDADRAVHLASQWPKGYFRKGRALAGLKLYADAEQAFMHVLKLDPHCEDAMQELLRVRTFQLTDMGFSRVQAEQTIRQHQTVQQALDALLSGVGQTLKLSESSLAGEVYVSDDEDYTGPTNNVITYTNSALPTVAFPPKSGNDSKMDSTNPEGLTALWVGNVLPEVSQTMLHALFSRCGTVTSIRMLPEKYCAFVNFKNKEAAGKAMGTLQGCECAGQRLLVKFPDNPSSSGSVLIRKNGGKEKENNTSNTASLSTNKSFKEKVYEKLSGPVNGDECYFWRTTGCQFGINCNYRHVKGHKGIDRKPWQRA